MTVSLTHAFTSAKGDGSDPTQIQPSNWNAQHALTCDANSLVGNSTGSSGAVSAIPCTAQGRSILAATVLADLIAAGIPLSSTGDVKLTLKTVADTGWIMCNDQTIGNAGSGAVFADPSAQNLYTLIWNNVAQAWAHVSSGRGASAAADWGAGKTIALTSMMGRAIAISGSGVGLSARSLGQALGEENHQLINGELPSHTHNNSLNDPGHTHGLTIGPTPGFSNPTVVEAGGSSGNGTAVQTATTGVTITNASVGGNNPHNNMQPTSFLNAMIKL